MFLIYYLSLKEELFYLIHFIYLSENYSTVFKFLFVFS